VFRYTLPVLKIYSICNVNYRFSVLAVHSEHGQCNAARRPEDTIPSFTCRCMYVYQSIDSLTFIIIKSLDYKIPQLMISEMSRKNGRAHSTWFEIHRCSHVWCVLSYFWTVLNCTYAPFVHFYAQNFYDK